ncbi:MAG: TolC family outer membrane protein [Sphingomonadaceae bacterium]
MLRSLIPALALLASPAAADTLPEAIAAAYATNPQIAAARAALRQVDEGVPLARSATLPSASLDGSFSQSLSDQFGDLGRIWRGGVTLRQSIFQGGQVRANISAAEARILAQRARLRATEYRVLVDTVTAYADVLRTEAVVRLNENQVKVLGEQLRASRDRFEVGDLTRTDVAQSEARLAAAQAQLMAARAQQVVARQAYQRLVGRPPSRLAPLPALPPVPATENEAREIALEQNPTLVAARLDEKAAFDDVRAAKAQRGPSVGLQASGAYTRFEGQPAGLGPGASQSGFDPQIGVSASLPLFTGGAIAAQVRQAQARQSQALELIALNERLAAEGAVDSFVQLRTAESVIESAKVQVSANELAAEGVRQENLVGSRDILDVLNAEQELLNARVSLVQAERDRYVAAFRLLEAIGDIEPVLAGAPVGRYDAAANAARVRGKGLQEFGYDRDPRTDRTQNQAPGFVGPQP